jgi:hypothetical protein
MMTGAALRVLHVVVPTQPERARLDGVQPRVAVQEETGAAPGDGHVLPVREAHEDVSRSGGDADDLMAEAARVGDAVHDDCGAGDPSTERPGRAFPYVFH